MKKLIIFASVLAMLALVSISHAQTVVGGGMYVYQTASTSVVAVIPPQEGKIAIVSGNSYFPSASATLYKLPASAKSKTAGAVAASTTMLLVGDNAAGVTAVTADGCTVATNGWVIVPDTTASTTTKPQLRQFSTIGTNQTVGGTNYVSVVLSAAVTTGKGAPVYLVASGDVITKTLSAAENNVESYAIGNYGMPLAVSMVSTGVATTAEISGTYQVWK